MPVLGMPAAMSRPRWSRLTSMVETAPNVLTPITMPQLSNSGPPELPLLMLALCWMTGRTLSFWPARPSTTLPTTPWVTVELAKAVSDLMERSASPGKPIAQTCSPLLGYCSGSALESVSGGRFRPGTLTTARSNSEEDQISCAGLKFLVEPSTTTRSAVAPSLVKSESSTTCSLVTTYSSVTTKP